MREEERVEDQLVCNQMWKILKTFSLPTFFILRTETIFRKIFLNRYKIGNFSKLIFENVIPIINYHFCTPQNSSLSNIYVQKFLPNFFAV